MKCPQSLFIATLLLCGILPMEIAIGNPMQRRGEDFGFPVLVPTNSYQQKEGKTLSLTFNRSTKSRNVSENPYLVLEAATVRGKLDSNSYTLPDDGSYYNIHTFEGVAGESIFIELTSEEFDPYLVLLDWEGNTIAENDDWGEEKKARIVITLNHTSSYQILVNSYGSGELGNYTLSWGDASPVDVQKVEAEGLLQNGVQQLNQGQFPEALATFQQALTRFREIGDRSGEGKTLNNLGSVYDNLGQYPKAIEFYQQALAIIREVRNHAVEGTILSNLGSVYDNLGQYPKAIEFYQQALAMIQEVGDKSGEGTILNNLGLVYDNLGQYPKAIEFYQQALFIHRELGSRAEEGTTLGNLGGVYDILGQYPQAIEFYQQALAIAQEVGNKSGEGTTLNNLGLVYNHLGQYPQAIEFYQQALFIIREVGTRAEEGTTLNNLGLVYDNLGQYPQAIEFYQQALSIRREVGDRVGEGITLNNLGLAYDNLGQYPKAIEFYQQALFIRREVGDRSGEGKTLNNLGAVYLNLGQYPQATEFFQPALEIARELGTSAEQGTALNNLGLVYNNLEQYTEAIEFYQQALFILREVGNRAEEGTTLSNLGLVYNNLGQYPQATEFFQQALFIHQEVGNRPMEGTTLNNLGLAYNNLGQYPKAIEFYQQALFIHREVGDRSGEGITLSNLGALYNNLEQYPKAERNLFDAIIVWESLRPSELDDKDKISLFDTQAHTYRLLQEVLIAQNQTETALEIAERGRARAFVDLLWQRLSNETQPTLPSPTLVDIQQVARDQNAILVEYSITQEDLYIWVISPTGNITFRSVKIAEKTGGLSLQELVNTSRFAMGVRSRSLVVVPRETDTGDATTTQTRLKQLHQLLIEPISDLLPQTPEERVIFIPHGELFLVPFPALQDANGTDLIETHTILTAPAIQVLQLTGRQGDRETGNWGDDLVVGNPVMPSIVLNPGDPPVSLRPLPGAEIEAKAIADILKTQPLLGSAATEPAVVERMQTARIVHLATHGILDDVGGMSSSIALTPAGERGDGGNGFLTAEEILKLNLNADLVVLSACDTGRGKITGDGVVGLSRSLVTAGVSSLVVSLWQVPDGPTAELMTQFYENLQQGLDKATALRKAMLETRETYADPVNWAAFTLIGEVESIRSPNSDDR
jgi:tetratricopeptide (TPR) repeat protein